MTGRDDPAVEKVDPPSANIHRMRQRGMEKSQRGLQSAEAKGRTMQDVILGSALGVVENVKGFRTWQRQISKKNEKKRREKRKRSKGTQGRDWKQTRTLRPLETFIKRTPEGGQSKSKKIAK